jgi:hypothetical protein
MTGFAVAALMLMVWFVTGVCGSVYKAKARSVRDAIEALNQHFDALETVIESDAVSESLKKLLLSSSDLFASREMALKLMSREKSVLSADDRVCVNEIMSEIQKLRAEEPDIASAIDDVIVCGLLAAVFRYQQMIFEVRVAPEPLIKREKERIKGVIEGVATVGKLNPTVASAC